MSRLSCLALGAALFCGLSFAQTESGQPLPVVNVGFYEFPPYTYSAADGAPEGSALRLTERLLKHAGYHPVFRSLPGARLYAGLRDGSVHLWPGAPGKEELKGYTLESRSVLGEFDLALYFRRDTLLPRLPEDLSGRGIILISGYSYWKPYRDWLSDPVLNIEQHRTSSHTSALEMLQRHRGDFLLDYVTPVEQARQRLGMAELPYVVLHRLRSKLIVSRRAPDAQKLLDALDGAYAELAAQGEDLRLP